MSAGNRPVAAVGIIEDGGRKSPDNRKLTLATGRCAAASDQQTIWIDDNFGRCLRVKGCEHDSARASPTGHLCDDKVGETDRRIEMNGNPINR